MFTKKYFPKKIDDIVGNDSVKESVKRWILKWLRGEKQKPILIYGPPGVGKTSMAYAIANEYNLDLIEISSSELRDAKHIERKVSPLAEQNKKKKKRIVLIDDIDAMTGKDRGGISALSKMLQKAKIPIIITANDAWDRKLSPIRNEVILLEMKAVSSSSLYEFLKKIALKENLKVDDEKLREIARKTQGDVRAALNDLEVMLTGYRDKKINIFEVLAKIFKASSLKEAKSAYLSSDVDLDTLKLWMAENIINEYEKNYEIAEAYNYLSKADIFDGRILKRQYWGFLRYSSILLVGGIALAKVSKYRKFTRYKFPSYLKEMANSSKRRGMLNSICKKIGKKIHESPSTVRENIAFYSMLVEREEEKAKFYYKLSDEEIKFIKSLNKIKKIM